jgi:hypothetical protein
MLRIHAGFGCVNPHSSLWAEQKNLGYWHQAGMTAPKPCHTPFAGGNTFGERHRRSSRLRLGCTVAAGDRVPNHLSISASMDFFTTSRCGAA